MQTDIVLQEELISLDSSFQSKAECIAFMAEKLAKLGRVESAAQFIKAVEEREQLASTYTTMSVAMPHGISQVVKQSSLCFIRNQTEFDWDGDGDSPVHMIFLIAVEKGKNVGQANEQLALLSKICVMLLDDALREKLDKATTPAEVIQIISGYSQV